MAEDNVFYIVSDEYIAYLSKIETHVMKINQMNVHTIENMLGFLLK